MKTMKGYSAEIEVQMQRYYQSLSEKDRRRYAAIEAVKLEYGGAAYIRRLLGCHPETLERGIRELQDQSIVEEPRIRQRGGGRKSAMTQIEGIDAAFLRVLAKHTAGSPMDERIKWTNLTRQQIASLLEREGIVVSVTVVDQLLEKYDYRKRQAVKKRSGGGSEHRDAQFQNIDRLKAEYQKSGNPVLSMDTKKKS
jgi:Rhodopirellula transposase DDE domain